MKKRALDSFSLKEWAFFLLIMLTQSCVTDPDLSSRALGVGDSLPEFRLTLADGEVISTSLLRGKVSVIVFFNTSCPDCRKELPVVDKLYLFFEDNPEVKIFGVARNEEYGKIESYWKENSLSLPFSPQSDTKIYNLFASSSIPRIFISSPEGVITASFDDKEMPGLETLIDAVNEALE